ncbi:hypothetical protein GF406_04790 [candidate division KSB1 bacterium]|nr:hypothetical protein [candidate division KSB1 bacterium]
MEIMMDQNDIIKILKDRLPELRKEYNISKIGLIGSFARNEQTEKSDIDILFDFRPGTKDIHEKKEKLRDYLSKQLHRDVDLCREKYIKPYFKDYLKRDVIYV